MKIVELGPVFGHRMNSDVKNLSVSTENLPKIEHLSVECTVSTHKRRS